MVARRPHPKASWRTYIAATLKGVRRLRNVRSPEMAARLHLSLRAYENFENGRGRLNVERILRVATLLKADPHAMLTALEIGSPDFAQRCANNKLMSILLLAIRDFDAKAQDAIVGLDPLFLMKAFSAFFDQLAEHAAEQQEVITRWQRLRDNPGGEPEDGGPTDG
jgi:transcriptional regulator with XRE-family HTH domain